MTILKHCAVLINKGAEPVVALYTAMWDNFMPLLVKEDVPIFKEIINHDGAYEIISSTGDFAQEFAKKNPNSSDNIIEKAD